MDQICINSPENIAGAVASAVAVFNVIVNFVPDPDKLTNPVAKMASRILHFLAIDIVTAKK